MLPDCRRSENALRTSVTHLAASHVPPFGSCFILTSSTFVLLNRSTATWNLIVYLMIVTHTAW